MTLDIVATRQSVGEGVGDRLHAALVNSVFAGGVVADYATRSRRSV